MGITMAKHPVHWDLSPLIDDGKFYIEIYVCMHVCMHV